MIVNYKNFLMGYLFGNFIAGQRMVSSGGNTTPTGIYDDEFPIEWNSLAVQGNVSVDVGDSITLRKISNLAPAASEWESITLTATDNTGTYNCTFNSASDDGGVTGVDYNVKIGTLSGTFTFISVRTIDETAEQIGITETGLYMMEQGSGDVDFTLSLPVTASTYLYGREADSVVSYNGVELPDIETVWTDKETYPYALIYSNDGKYYYLYAYNAVPTVNKSGNIILPANCSYMTCAYGNSESWGSVTTATTTAAANIGSGSALVWTNADILDNKSTTYLAASDPVKSYTDADVIVDGMGYKGAVLPMLPELTGDYLTMWREEYESAGYTKYTLIASSVQFAWQTDHYAISNCTKQQAVYYTNNGEWTVYDVQTDSYANMYGSPVWANYDLTLGDGSVLQGTDPIPIYE